MIQAEKGDRVKIHYRGKLTDGTVFDICTERDPLELTLGRNEAIEGLEEAVVGMKPGSRKTVRIPPAKAFGDREEQRVVVVGHADLPEWLEPEVGQVLRSREPGGGSMLVSVVDVAGDSVTVDTNHPLAGEEIILEIGLAEIV